MISYKSFAQKKIRALCVECAIQCRPDGRVGRQPVMLASVRGANLLELAGGGLVGHRRVAVLLRLGGT